MLNLSAFVAFHARQRPEALAIVYESQRITYAALQKRTEVLSALLASRGVRAGQVVAGAFNVASATRLYGRYWGCFEDHPFLHFHVCLYHSVDDCIQRGLQVFEGGAGGEHKMSRGFEPSETYSAHAFADPRLHAAFAQALAHETMIRQQELSEHRKEKA